LLLEGVFQRFGFDFRGYERGPLRRKLHRLMHAAGIKTVSSLQDQVMHDESMTDALLRALIEHPDALIGNPDRLCALRQVLGSCLRSHPAPRIWIAECSCAADAGILAILLEEEALLDKTEIFATCTHPTLLEEARTGSFALDRAPEYEENYRHGGGTHGLSRYYRAYQGQAIFIPELLDNFTWAQFNPVTDASFNEFQLIVCHKIFPDFGLALRHRVLGLFHGSLAIFGILSISPARDIETAPFSTSYQAISPHSGMYKRIG
jgi:chemotaxis protein methyltransferase CheR